MTLNCPACRKPNDFHRSSSVCPRCAADLTHLWAVNTAAEQALQQAARALRQCHWPAALAAAGRSWSLRHHPQAAGIAFLAAAAAAQTTLACQWLERANAPDSPSTDVP